MSGNANFHNGRKGRYSDPEIQSPFTWLASVIGISQEMLRPVFVFAHPDDAAFSAFFALIETRSQALDIVVCAGLPPSAELGSWDRQCGFSSSRDAIQVRRREHEVLCQFLRIRSKMLDGLDDQYCDAYRGSFQFAVSPILDMIRSDRANIIITHCWSPIHPDHRRVVAFARDAAYRLRIPVVFTCDRPYFSCSAEYCQSSLGKKPLSMTCSITLPKAIWCLKAEAIQFYISQHSALKSAFGLGWSDIRRIGRECYSIVLNSKTDDFKTA